MTRALRIFTLFLAFFALSAGKAPEDLRLKVNDKKGIVLVKVDQNNAEFHIRLVKRGKTGFMSRVYAIDGRDDDEIGRGEIFLAAKLKPARYQLDTIWQQSAFGIAIEPKTYEFDVEAGKVVYLGKLNTGELLRIMQSEAIRTGNTTGGGGSGFLSKTGLGIAKFTARDDLGVSNAREFVTDVMGLEDSQFKLAALIEQSDPGN